MLIQNNYPNFMRIAHWISFGLIIIGAGVLMYSIFTHQEFQPFPCLVCDQTSRLQYFGAGIGITFLGTMLEIFYKDNIISQLRKQLSE